MHVTKTADVSVQVSAVDISGGKGFVSCVYKCTIHFSRCVDTYSVIMKVPGVESFNKLSDDIHESGKDNGVSNKIGGFLENVLKSSKKK